MSLTLDNQKLLVLLSNSSIHAIYDLQVHITDYQSRSDLIAERPAVQNSSGFLKVFNPCDISVDIHVFDKHTTVILAALPELYAFKHTLKVHTILTHGCFVQYQEFSHIGTHQWIFAEKVVNETTDKVLYRRFPTRFTQSGNAPAISRLGGANRQM
jgi:hypothetical protein